MDDKLIDSLIQSDEIISQTITEANKSAEESIDDILSSVMSISTGNAEKIEKEVLNQATKETQNIKASLTGTLNANPPTIQEIANIEAKGGEGSVSDETMGNLTSVMSNLEDVLNQINTSKSTVVTTSGEQLPKLSPEIEGIEQGTNQQIDIDKLSTLINDFKSISTLDWASKWLSYVQKIVDEVGVIKEELNTLPTESKLNLGINEESLNKVQEGFEQVKENITSEINVLPSNEETPAEEGIMGTSFLSGFSDFFKNLYSVPEKVESGNLVQEGFFDNMSNFEEGEMKAVEMGISEIIPESIQQIGIPEITELPLGLENVFGGLKSTFSSLFGGGEEEEEETPLALTEIVEPKISETPVPKEPGTERKSLAELFQMAYGQVVEEEEEVEEVEEVEGIAETKVKQSIAQPPALVENFEDLLSTGSAPMPPITPEMTATAPFSVEALTGGIFPPMPPITPVIATNPKVEETTTAQNALPTPPVMAQVGEEALVESLFNFETTGAIPMPPAVQGTTNAVPTAPQSLPMPVLPETPVESLFDFETTGAMPMPPAVQGAGAMPMPPAVQGAGAMPMPPAVQGATNAVPTAPQSLPMPVLPETPVESLFDFETTGAMPMPPAVQETIEAKTPTEALPTPNAPVLEAIQPEETFQDIIANILKNKASKQATPPAQMGQGISASGFIPPLPPSKMNVEAVETTGITKNLGAMASEAIPFGAEILPPPSTTGVRAEGALAPPPALEFSPFEMSGGEMFGGMSSEIFSQSMPMPINELMPFGAGMEDVLIKNQAQKGPELSSAISKIQSSEIPSTAPMAIESEVMMKEVNLEPLGERLSSSIDNLGSSIATPVASATPTPNSFEVNNQSATQPESSTTPETQGQGSGMGSIPMGSPITEAQARLIGRQIANEIKSSLSKLYN